MSGNHTAINKQHSSRPFRVTLVALGVLMLGVINLTRLIQSVEQWEFLTGVLPISPLYLAFTGLFWALVFLPAAWGAWRGLRWAPRFTELAALVYAAYYWIDRLLVSNAARRARSLPFAASLTVISLAFIFWTFSRTNAKDFFGASHDSRPENQTTA